MLAKRIETRRIQRTFAVSAFSWKHRPHALPLTMSSCRYTRASASLHVGFAKSSVRASTNLTEHAASSPPFLLCHQLSPIPCVPSFIARARRIRRDRKHYSSTSHSLRTFFYQVFPPHMPLSSRGSPMMKCPHPLFSNQVARISVL